MLRLKIAVVKNGSKEKLSQNKGDPRMCRLSGGRYFIASYSKPFSCAFVRTIVFFLLVRGEQVATSYCLLSLSSICFQLMSTRDDGNNSPDLRPRSGKDLVVSRNQCSGVNIIVWGLHKELTTLEVCAKFAAMGLESCGRETTLG